MNLCTVYAVEEQQNSNDIVIVPDIMMQRSLHKKDNTPVEVNQKIIIDPKDVKHLPWSMTEKRIEYDSRGQAQFTPYALNDLNLQY